FARSRLRTARGYADAPALDAPRFPPKGPWITLPTRNAWATGPAFDRRRLAPHTVPIPELGMPRAQADAPTAPQPTKSEVRTAPLSGIAPPRATQACPEPTHAVSRDHAERICGFASRSRATSGRAAAAISLRDRPSSQ